MNEKSIETQQPQGSNITALEIILSILLPPVGVFMRYGLSGKFWLNFVLTLLGWLPGVIHGFYVLLK